MAKRCDWCGKDASGRKAKRYKEGKLLLCFTCSFERSRFLENADKQRRLPMIAIKDQLITERGNYCEKCGSTKNIVAHHIVRLMDGGANTADNIKLLCEDCHNKEHYIGTRW